MERNAPEHIMLEDHDLIDERPQPKEESGLPKSLKPKGTIPMHLPHMKDDPPFTPEHSEQQEKWFDNERTWVSEFKRAAETNLREQGFADALVTDFRSLLGEKDEFGYDMGYDEHDFEITFQYGRAGNRVGEGNMTTAKWKVRRVTGDSLRS